MKGIGIIVVIALVALEWGCESAKRSPQVVHLVSFSPTTCDSQSDPMRVQNRILWQKVQQDTLYFEIGFVENCCIAFNPAIAFRRDTLRIVLDQKDSSRLCRCLCCYGASLAVSGISDTTGLTILLENQPLSVNSHPYKVFPVSYQLEGQDTINYQDQNGFRQGLWKIYGNGKLLGEEYYQDDAITWFRMYYPNQKLWKESFIRADTTLERGFYPTGGKQYECVEVKKQKKRCQQFSYTGRSIDFCG